MVRLVMLDRLTRLTGFLHLFTQDVERGYVERGLKHAEFLTEKLASQLEKALSSGWPSGKTLTKLHPMPLLHAQE